MGHVDKDFKKKDHMRWVNNKRKTWYFKCGDYSHFAMECKKPERDKELKEEALISQVPDEVPALLMVRCDEKQDSFMLINEEKVTPKMGPENCEKAVESNLWYLENGGNNYMSG